MFIRHFHPVLFVYLALKPIFVYPFLYPFLGGFQDTSAHLKTPRDTRNRRLYLALAIFLGNLSAFRSCV
jgi:hypothetical protein